MLVRMPTIEPSIVERSMKQPSATIDSRAVQSFSRAPGQIARVRVDRPAGVVELERRAGAREHDVGLVERRDRADVGPVAAEQVRVHAIAPQRRRDDLPPEVGGALVLDRLEQHIAREDVDAHRRDERLLRRMPAEHRAGRNAAADLVEPLALRLLLERDDLAAALEPEDAHRRGVVHRHRLRRDRDVGVAFDVRVDQLAVVHPIEMIAGEDEVIVGVVADEMARRLADRISRPLIPVRIVRRLLGRQNFDRSLAERVHPVGLRDVPVQRRGIELCEHEDAPDISVQAVADRNIDEPVAAADRHRGLGSMMRERKQSRSLAAAQDDRQNFVVHRHGPSKSYSPAFRGVTTT